MGCHYDRNTEAEKEYEILLTLMADMITAQALSEHGNFNVPAWSADLHNLSKKLFRHLCSARALLEPCGFRTANLPPYSAIDHSSVALVTRSAIENYLVMNWLYAGGDEAIRTFRHNVWEYGGWKKRSKFVATTDEAKIARQKAADDAALLLPMINANPAFQAYHPERKKAIRQGNWQAGTTWNQLAEEAGLHRTYFTSLYPYLSGYAHSDYISSLQVGQAVDLPTQYDLAMFSINIGLMVMGHFALFYAGLFPAAQTVLNRADVGQELVGKWALKAEDMDFLYAPEDQLDQPESRAE